MEKRICPHCEKSAFSSRFEGKWKCPNCGEEVKEEGKAPITTEQVLPKTTPEMCPNCMNEVEIPANEPSKCPECGEDILPCSTCYDQIDGKKPCGWDEDARCWRFPK